MAKICYTKKRFGAATLGMIGQANTIIEEYQAQGFFLTLRQLYYQFVSRDLLANKVTEYKRLGSIINDARLAGLIDWTAIEDRTRNLHRQPSWTDPESIIGVCADSFRLDLWSTQPVRVEVWIEKEALAGVFERVCDDLRIPFFCCRGYTSQSEMWVASQRLRRYRSDGQEPVILHFGDHDPSGIDMTRDITDRLELFSGVGLDPRRLALTMAQIRQYDPPPNPAKETDSRFAGYLKTFGDESWELDALEPAVLAKLVEKKVGTLREDRPWKARLKEENQHRATLAACAAHWSSVVGYLDEII